MPYFRHALIPLLALATGLTLTLALYALAWTGHWHFDDHANLSGLLNVFGDGSFNAAAAQQFVFSGDAGPLGRPIALASFLIDGSTWPASPRALLYSNTLLHLLNGLLLCGLWLAVLRQRGPHSTATPWVAVAASLLWLLQPLLVSSALMPVQRMTLLSSTFMLLGAWLYVVGRVRLEQRPTSGWLLMLGGLGGGTLLGVFSKEQAAVLPLLLWVLERWALQPPTLKSQQKRLWRAFKAVGFYLPTLLVFGYLGRRVINYKGYFPGRDFNLPERLWTESIILWDYLRLTVMPRSFEFGPFHDDYPIHNASLPALMAVAAWLILLVLCWRLRPRTRWPLFALLWYTAAHLIESSVIALELYFEHRNYLAIAGPLLALVALCAKWSANSRMRKQAVATLLSLYGLLLAFVLWQVTSTFGHPAVAARLWYEQHPTSVRAAQNLASELSDANDIQGALHVLDEVSARLPQPDATQIQALQLACVLDEPQPKLEQRLQLLLATLPTAHKRYSINDTLNRLKLLMERKACGGFITQETLVKIAETALSSPAFNSQAKERSNLHFFISTLYIDARNLGMSMRHMEAAMQAVPQLVTLDNMVTLLSSAGLYSEALELFDQYPVRWPKNATLRQQQQQRWQRLKSQVEQHINNPQDSP